MDWQVAFGLSWAVCNTGETAERGALLTTGAGTRMQPAHSQLDKAVQRLQALKTYAFKSQITFNSQIRTQPFTLSARMC